MDQSMDAQNGTILTAVTPMVTDGTQIKTPLKVVEPGDTGPSDKDGDGGDWEDPSVIRIKPVSNGFVVSFAFKDETIHEVYHTLEETLFSIESFYGAEDV